ncbi:DNA-binding protein [Dipodascopsis tothii]|uniref:DNA-binding protein n=1 Tax=Dipodascopsis tothii TaxID=44089 RepID=UPI0034CD1B79
MLYARMLAAYAEFLVVAIHTILYERGIYPAEAFAPARKYNFPVKQCRHGGVCDWVLTAVGECMRQIRAAAAAMAGGSAPNVARLAVVVLAPDTQRPLERFVFDVSGLALPPGGVAHERQTVLELDHASLDDEAGVAEQFRSCLARLVYAPASLGRLPAGCTFTVTLEFDAGGAPAGAGDAVWIVADEQPEPGGGARAPRTRPLRNVVLGPLSFGMWVEEAAAKGKLRE